LGYVHNVDEELKTKRLIHLRCDECGEVSDLQARGWQAYLAHEDGGSESVAVFCPWCVVEFAEGA